jgi:hypothetical protein
VSFTGPAAVALTAPRLRKATPKKDTSKIRTEILFMDSSSFLWVVIYGIENHGWVFALSPPFPLRFYEASLASGAL